MSILVPVMIRTFGRTGSTLLMQILGTSERVCFERRYPFEQRYLTYVHNMARMVSLPHRQDSTWNNDIMFAGKSPVIGPLPYPPADGFSRERLSERCFKSLWEQFSLTMREQHGITPNEAAFYAEKVPHGVADVANKLMQSKNVFLLRDPRDEMVSIKKFNEKRGFNSFGWQEGDSDLSYATKMCRTHHGFLKHLVAFESDTRRIAVRYEDLIRNGEEEVAKLSAWLGTEMSIKKAQKDKAVRKKHMTSSTADSSVERWKEELSSDVLNVFSRELGNELSTLGYSV